MKLSRRRFLQFGAGAAMIAPMPVLAQGYPTRPVRIVSGFAAGGVNDVMARLIGQSLSERLGHPVIIENRPGSSSNIATKFAINSVADGYTLLAAGTSNAVNATLYKSLDFNFIRDVAPIATIARVPQVMEVHPSVPAATVAEFIAYAKANPHKINMASAGNGSVQNVAGELFKMRTGLDMVHVPYKGAGQALVDLLSGQMQVMFDTTPGSINHIRAGRLRALAVTTISRADVLPDAPPIADFVPGYEASQWYGLVAARNTPADIVAKLNREVNAAIADPAMKTRLADFGGTPFAGTSADFGDLIVKDTAKWAEVVKFSGARID